MSQSNSQAGRRPPLLTTNMRVPQLHGELTTRTGLLEKLDQIVRFPLTLVSAPAGFGKTTALVQWITGDGRDTLHERVAWVSLERESDLHRFWRYVLFALDQVQPEIAKPALALFDSPQPPLYAIPTHLINEISSLANDFVLVLDDYHLVDDPGVHTALDFLVEHLPANLHVVLASRSEPPLPLARWRAGGRLYELREEDLRFSSVEAATFLNETKGLNLSDKDVAALEARTEGWIAGLQLVALSMQGDDDTSKHRFISAFTGSHRYIFDYLTTEALQRQPESIRAFLLQTSVLDRLNAALCDAVTGRADGQVILEHLERSNLFTTSLDQERRWFRYHHLFRDVLRHRLQQEQPNVEQDLQRRAAAWYMEHGQPEIAIHHACAAREWQQAIELIGTRIDRTWNRGEIRRILNWLGKIPDRYLDANPDLSLYYSRALLLGGQMEAAEQRLREAETVLRDRLSGKTSDEDRLLLGTVSAFRTTLAAVRGETTSALALGQEALKRLPEASIDIRGHAINSLGVAHYYLGQMVDASQRCAQAGELARQAGNHYLVMAAAAYGAKALMCLGQLTEAAQILEQALNHPPTWPDQTRIPAASVACASYGRLLYEWNDLEEAEGYLTEAIELGQYLAFGSALWSAYHTLARIRLAQGDQDGAQSMIEHAQRYRESHSVPLPVRLMEAELAASRLALGQTQSVQAWARTVRSDSLSSPAFLHEIESLTLARLSLLLERPQRALAVLEQLRSPAETSQRKGHTIEALALSALAHHAHGQTPLAVEMLREALSLAHPEGYVRTFVDLGQPMAALLYKALASDVHPDYAGKLLALFPERDMEPDTPAMPVSSRDGAEANEALVEPLTPREVEVLQLIADGASNNEIAQELTIALTTAKKHVSNIIKKLEVDNRTEAAAKGRRFGLCE